MYTHVSVRTSKIGKTSTFALLVWPLSLIHKQTNKKKRKKKNHKAISCRNNPVVYLCMCTEWWGLFSIHSQLYVWVSVYIRTGKVSNEENCHGMNDLTTGW